MINPTWLKIQSMEIGQELCDMHYGYPQIPKCLIHCVPSVECENATEIVESLIQGAMKRAGYEKTNVWYTNKMAVLVGTTSAERYQFAYSYDGTRFGMFTVSLDN